ncbi:MAG: RNA methyltransferase [bacterium]|nr:RNA methyltransferase [bacterium]
MKLLSLIQRIKADSKFAKKKKLTIIDDLETFKTFLKLKSYYKFPIEKIFTNSRIDLDKLQIDIHFGNFKNDIEFIEEETLKKILNIDNPQICVLIRIPENIYNYSDNFVDLLRKNGICIVLDSIQNPWNLGGILRTNSAFNIFSVILLGNSVFPLNPRVIRASKGYVFEQNIKIFNINEFKQILSNLEEEIEVFLLENKEASENINDLELTQKISFFILGNEETGINQEVKRVLKKSKSIKIEVRIESLNVFATHSILAFFLSKNKGFSK